ncbi:hypothetical protein ACIA9I_11130 [Streptomyces anulatus]
MSVHALRSRAVHHMPSGARGALIQRVSAQPGKPLNVTRLATESPRLPLGRIRLHWEPLSPTGWNVTAHLVLATAKT